MASATGIAALEHPGLRNMILGLPDDMYSRVLRTASPTLHWVLKKWKVQIYSEINLDCLYIDYRN